MLDCPWATEDGEALKDWMIGTLGAGGFDGEPALEPPPPPHARVMSSAARMAANFGIMETPG